MTTNSLSTHVRRRLSPWLVLGIAIAVTALICGIIFFIVRQDPIEKIDITEEDTTITSEDDEINPAGVSEEDKFNEVDQYEGANPNSLETLTGSLTHVTSDGTNLIIRVNIDQALSEGNCRLNLTAGDNLYSFDAFIFSTGSIYSSCEGFDVPLSELTASNVWTIKITLTSGDKTGEIIGEARL